MIWQILLQRSVYGQPTLLASDNMLKVFSILDVGDGACSVMRHDEHATIIDCGSNDLGPDVACNRLLAAIGGRPEIITTIVVTHFDTDHYAGFLRLAERMSTVGSRFKNLRLIAPRPPDEETIIYRSISCSRHDRNRNPQP